MTMNLLNDLLQMTVKKRQNVHILLIEEKELNLQWKVNFRLRRP